MVCAPALADRQKEIIAELKTLNNRDIGVAYRQIELALQLRKIAEDSLEGIGPGLSPRTVDELKKMLRDPNPYIRKGAALSIAQTIFVQGPEVRHLISALWLGNDPAIPLEQDSDVRSQIMHAFGELKHEQLRPPARPHLALTSSIMAYVSECLHLRSAISETHSVTE